MIIQIEPGSRDKYFTVISWTLHTDICWSDLSEVNEDAEKLIAFANKYNMKPFSEPEVGMLNKWGEEEVTLSIRVKTIKHLPKKLPEGVFLNRG